jgi:hypothetical protein
LNQKNLNIKLGASQALEFPNRMDKSDSRSIFSHQLEGQEYPLTLAEEIFQLVGGFVYATSLDLSMGYLHINLAQSARNIFTVVMSFGFYKCTKLQMGVMPATDIFQSRMVSVFADM